MIYLNLYLSLGFFILIVVMGLRDLAKLVDDSLKPEEKDDRVLWWFLFLFGSAAIVLLYPFIFVAVIIRKVKK